MKVLKCADMGSANCDAVFKAETVDDVLIQAEAHAASVHGMTSSPEMAEKAKSLIQDEPMPAESAPAADVQASEGQTPPPASGV